MGTIYVQQDPVDGTFTAHVLELPGCNARGGTREDAVEKVKHSFRDYLALLRSRGMSVDHLRETDVDRFEVKDPPSRGIFPEDFRQMDEHEMRDFLRQMEASRSALLAQLRGLSAEQLEKQPTPSMWSVRVALEHIMETEVALLSKLERWPDREFATLQAVHRLTFQRFTVMDPADTAMDHTIEGRRWSTRTVMRRILEHEYEHLGHIREIVAALGSDRPPE
ncbi:MAG: type II toxin-antitoxin system HicB family antitoxin [Chloroflexota bacterium]|nr:type II toxin-antitoxin system HicB family antitoxin [Chloroflexota bacterium]